jgi:predicted AlkP superfamily phosphohydrolase/phosphomutase
MILVTALPVEAKRVVILGIDGLDPRLLERYMADGRLPNFSRLVAEGDMRDLQTSAAPQSPVAWSTFITGMDPGGHGIYDFVHRDPATMLPYLSMSRAVPAERNLALGSWVIPISGARVELLRQGRAFWEILGEADVPTTIFRMPVNFPPVEAPDSRQVSGMGTPDIQGTSGTFSYFTDVLPDNADSFTGGKAFSVTVSGDRVEAKLPGPTNPFRRMLRNSSYGNREYESPQLTADFTVFLDRESKSAKFEVGGREFVLGEREWSDWVEVDFEAVPWVASISALARFYLKEVTPGFKLYVSPLQINPEDPVMPISSPPDWSKQLCSCLDFFYTQELPHDTKAFTYGVFSGREFWKQLEFVNDEARLIFRHLFEEHSDGLLFFYFGSVDQGSHMLWHYTDEKHPNHQPDDFLAGGIRATYERMDDVLGTVLDGIDGETTLIVMSDHGFSPFYRGVNLNTWLLEKGYVSLSDPSLQEESEFFLNVDWKRTTAYALGLNGLYLNVRGRERGGTVAPGKEYEEILDRLEADLLAMRDPETGERAVTKVTRPGRDFSGPFKDSGPDLMVGYNWGYRSSWESPLGKFPREVFVDNMNPWSGDHCIDARHVPGVLISNRKITLASPALHDLTVAVLDEYGVPPLPEMIGKDCLGEGDRQGEVSLEVPGTLRGGTAGRLP